MLRVAASKKNNRDQMYLGHPLLANTIRLDNANLDVLSFAYILYTLLGSGNMEYRRLA
jgi:hypothetical protein